MPHQPARPFASARPPGLPPIRRPGRRFAILFGVLAGAIALLVGGLYLHGRLTPHHTVLIENGNAFAVDLDIGGEALHLAAHAHTTARAHDGALTVTARGPGGFAESSSIELPASGYRTAGRFALYNVGGASQLAVVTITYGTVAGDHTPPIALVPRAPKLGLVPAGVTGAIDEPFQHEITTRRWGELVRHVCHVDPIAERLGCPGADASDE